MQRFMLYSKLHRLTVTDANLDYMGSITIDKDLLKAADIKPGQMVHVVSITNGNRFETYTIPGKKGEVCINGAAAHLAKKGDVIIVIAYVLAKDSQLKKIKPKIILVDKNNCITKAGG